MSGIVSAYLFTTNGYKVGLKARSFCQEDNGLTEQQKEVPASQMENEATAAVPIQIVEEENSVKKVNIGNDHYLTTGINSSSTILGCNNIGLIVYSAIKDENGNGTIDANETQKSTIWVNKDNSTVIMNGVKVEPRIVEIDIIPEDNTGDWKYYFATKVSQ